MPWLEPLPLIPEDQTLKLLHPNNSEGRISQRRPTRDEMHISNPCNRNTQKASPIMMVRRMITWTKRIVCAQRVCKDIT
jgi:hypothetical protein